MATAAWIPVSASLLADMGDPAYAYLNPDVSAYSSPFPDFDLFPRATVAWDWAVERSRRVAIAWAVLRGLPPKGWVIGEEADW